MCVCVCVCVRVCVCVCVCVFVICFPPLNTLVSISNGPHGVQREDLDSNHRLVKVTLRLKVEKRSSQRRGKRFDTALLGKMEMRLEYVEALRKSFNDRTKEGSVEERWSELK